MFTKKLKKKKKKKKKKTLNSKEVLHFRKCGVSNFLINKYISKKFK